jgi:hypothetical protein
MVERYQADLENQDHSTAQTVGLMAEQIRKCAQDPAVQAAARNALLKYSQGRAGAYAACWAVWWSIRHTVKFVSDDEILRHIPTPNPPELEALVSPSVMVRARNPQGDCDDFTMLACCFLECLGVPWEIVTVAADPGDSQRWSHVYSVATLEDGRRFVMDAAPPDAKYPGWEVPADHILRYQAWDHDGRPVQRERPIKRMQGYRRDWRAGFPVGMGAVVRRRRRRGMRGLGQVCMVVDPDTGLCTEYDSSSSSVGSGCYQSVLGETCTDASGNTTTTPISPSGLNTSTGSSFQNELNTLLNSWTTIASRVIAPTTTYTTAGGVTVTTPSSSTAAASLLSSSGIGGLSMGTILVLVAALGAVLLIAKK